MSTILRLWLLCLLVALPLTSRAQKYLLKPAITKPDCLSDSVYRAASRLRGKADVILTFCRYYDTGYYNENTETATIVWQAKGADLPQAVAKLRGGSDPAVVDEARHTDFVLFPAAHR